MSNEHGYKRLEAARYLGVKRSVLEHWEKNKVEGLVFLCVEINGRKSVHYPKAELKAFKEAHTFGEPIMSKPLKLQPQFVTDMFLHTHLEMALKHTKCTHEEREGINNYIGLVLFKYKQENPKTESPEGLCVALEQALGNMLPQTKVSTDDQKSLTNYLVNKLKAGFIEAGVLYSLSDAKDLQEKNYFLEKQDAIYEITINYEASHIYNEAA